MTQPWNTVMQQPQQWDASLDPTTPGGGGALPTMIDPSVKWNPNAVVGNVNVAAGNTNGSSGGGGNTPTAVRRFLAEQQHDQQQQQAASRRSRNEPLDFGDERGGNPVIQPPPTPQRQRTVSPTRSRTQASMSRREPSVAGRRSLLCKVLLRDETTGSAPETAFAGGARSLPDYAMINVTASSKQEFFSKLQGQLELQFDWCGEVTGISFVQGVDAPRTPTSPTAAAAAGENSQHDHHHGTDDGWRYYDRYWPAPPEGSAEYLTGPWMVNGEHERPNGESTSGNLSKATLANNPAAVRNLNIQNTQTGQSSGRSGSRALPVFHDLPIEMTVRPKYSVRQIRFVITYMTRHPPQVARLFSETASNFPEGGPGALRSSSPGADGVRSPRSPTGGGNGASRVSHLKSVGDGIHQVRASAYVDSISALLRALSQTVHVDVLAHQIFFVNPSRATDGSHPKVEATQAYQKLESVCQLKNFSYLLCDTLAPLPSIPGRGQQQGTATSQSVAPPSIPFFHVHPQNIAFDELKVRGPPEEDGEAAKAAYQRRNRPNSDPSALREEQSLMRTAYLRVPSQAAGTTSEEEEAILIAEARSKRALQAFRDRLKTRRNPGSINTTFRGEEMAAGNVAPSSGLPMNLTPGTFRFVVPHRVMTPFVPDDLEMTKVEFGESSDEQQRALTAKREEQSPKGSHLLPRREELLSDGEDDGQNLKRTQERNNALAAKKHAALIGEGSKSILPASVAAELDTDDIPRLAPLGLYQDVVQEAWQRFPRPFQGIHPQTGRAASPARAAMMQTGLTPAHPDTQLGSPVRGGGGIVTESGRVIAPPSFSVGTARRAYPTPAREKKELIAITMGMLREVPAIADGDLVFPSITLVQLTTDVVQAYRASYARDHDGIPMLFPLSKTDTEKLGLLVEQRVGLEVAAGGGKLNQKTFGSSLVSGNQAMESPSRNFGAGSNTNAIGGLHSPPRFDEEETVTASGAPLVRDAQKDVRNTADRSLDPTDPLAGPEPTGHLGEELASSEKQRYFRADHKPMLALTKPQVIKTMPDSKSPIIIASHRLTIYASCGVDIFANTGMSSAFRQEKMSVKSATPSSATGPGEDGIAAPPFRWYLERRSHNAMGRRHVEVALDAMLALGTARSFVVSHVPPITLGLEIDLTGRPSATSQSEVERDQEAERQRRARSSVLQPGVQYTIGLIINYRSEVDENKGVGKTTAAGGSVLSSGTFGHKTELPSSLHESHTFILPGNTFE